MGIPPKAKPPGFPIKNVGNDEEERFPLPACARTSFTGMTESASLRPYVMTRQNAGFPFHYQCNRTFGRILKSPRNFGHGYNSLNDQLRCICRRTARIQTGFYNSSQASRTARTITATTNPVKSIPTKPNATLTIRPTVVCATISPYPTVSPVIKEK